MQSKRFLAFIYNLFLGILLALFVGIGVNTFYPPPKQPEFPASLNYGKELSPAQIRVQQAYDVQMRDYNERMKPYNRNVSIITLVSAMVLLAVSLIFEAQLRMLADGVMLGGLFTLLYSVGRGFASADSRYLFIVIGFSLIVVFFLGFHRFARQPHTAPES